MNSFLVCDANYLVKYIFTTKVAAKVSVLLYFSLRPYYMTLQAEQSKEEDSMPREAPPLERHDKRSRTRLALSYFCESNAWCENHYFTLNQSIGNMAAHCT